MSESAEFLGTSLFNQIGFMMNFKALWDQTNVINIELTGTDVTNLDLTLWPMSRIHGLKYGQGIDETASDNIYLNYLKSVI